MLGHGRAVEGDVRVGAADLVGLLQPVRPPGQVELLVQQRENPDGARHPFRLRQQVQQELHVRGAQAAVHVHGAPGVARVPAAQGGGAGNRSGLN